MITLKQDIQSIEDIKFLIDNFYKKVITDKIIGYFFTEVVQLNWDEHIPTKYNFWETVLLGKASYKGNPIIKHIELNRKEKINTEYFAQWLKLWSETIDMHFEGDKSEEAKHKAGTMATLMTMKIKASTD